MDSMIFWAEQVKGQVYVDLKYWSIEIKAITIQFVLDRISRLSTFQVCTHTWPEVELRCHAKGSAQLNLGASAISSSCVTVSDPN
jgi:hypothetical protein